MQDNSDEVYFVKDIRARSNACYKCGEVGHFQRDCKYDRDKPTDGWPEQEGSYDSYNSVVGKWMTNLVATTPIMAKVMKSLYAEMNRQRYLKRSYRRKYKDLQAVATTTTDPPVAASWPAVITSTRGGSNPQMARATWKVPKPPNKRKKNVAKTSTSVANPTSPSANLRNKLQDKVKHVAVLVQEITEELQAIEEEYLNDDHNSEATQESDLEQEDSNNNPTNDDQWLFKTHELPFLVNEQKIYKHTDRIESNQM